jgi:voltage-gated potassium channel
MIGGISLIGMITATVAAWIVQRVAEEDNTTQAATAAQIDELRSQITQLTELLIERKATGVMPAPATDR